MFTILLALIEAFSGVEFSSLYVGTVAIDLTIAEILHNVFRNRAIVRLTKPFEPIPKRKD